MRLVDYDSHFDNVREMSLSLRAVIFPHLALPLSPLTGEEESISIIAVPLKHFFPHLM